MNILVFNCGSSSQSFKIFQTDTADGVRVIVSGKARRVGVKGTEPSSLETHLDGKTETIVTPLKNHRRAAALALTFIQDHGISVDCVGHRFVHGGNYFQHSVFLNEQTMRKLKLCRPLAPIHNPNSLSVIDECVRRLPEVTQYVAFDSAYHSSIPPYAYTYALPKRIVDKFGFRKYGFHGLSYSYVVREIERFLETPLRDLKIVACHLGTGGSSVAAIKDGRSVDTSMGYTPLPGLIMSTRCGDIDPMLAVYLMTTYRYRSEDLMEILSKKSGLLGVSGFSSDIRDIINRIGDNEEQAELAFKMYIHRVKKFIGSYVVELGGLDVLVFTDDIGVHSWQVREGVCEDMGWCGIDLDGTLNRQEPGEGVSLLNSQKSKVRIAAVPTDEEYVILLEGMQLLGIGHETIL
jgi:acetate kinase